MSAAPGRSLAIEPTVTAARRTATPWADLESAVPSRHTRRSASRQTTDGGPDVASAATYRPPQGVAVINRKTLIGLAAVTARPLHRRRRDRRGQGRPLDRRRHRVLRVHRLRHRPGRAQHRGAGPLADPLQQRLGLVRQPRDAHVDALAAERHALGLEQRALAGALRERAVGAHDPVPRDGRVVAAAPAPCRRSAARPATRRRRRARTPAGSSRILARTRAARSDTRDILARCATGPTRSSRATRQTGELGAAVQSHWFSVGSLCTWARPGVGAVGHAVGRRAGLRPARARPHGRRARAPPTRSPS